MSRLILLIFILAHSQISYSNNYQLAKEVGRQDSGDFLLLENLLEENQFQSPLEFLQFWKSTKPEYFENYVLAYRSRSLQQADFLRPRALIFNENADMIMAFNGHEQHEGYDAVEMVRFNHDNKAFEFYELNFNDNQAQLSGPNPQKCMVCHQATSRSNLDPRPNWEPYNMWPGFYGSIDDDTDLRRDSGHFRREMEDSGDEFLLDEVDVEPEMFYQFSSYVQPEHERYSLLSQSTIDQYGREETLNGDLTNRLAVLNFQRVARIIRTEHPELYEIVKWTVYGHARCGRKLFMKKEAARWLYEKVGGLDFQRFEEAAAEMDNRRVVYGEGPDGRRSASAAYRPPVRDFYNIRTTYLIDILFEAFGVNTSDWSMDFKTSGGRFSAFERFGVTNEPGPPWVYAIRYEFANDPDFADEESFSCDKAKQKSLEVFPDLDTTQSVWASLAHLRVDAPEKPLIQRCIQCHVDENYGHLPYIPFDNEEALSDALKDRGFQRGTLLEEILFRLGPHATHREQMPRGPVPTDEARENLIIYLESLVN